MKIVKKFTKIRDKKFNLIAEIKRRKSDDFWEKFVVLLLLCDDLRELAIVGKYKKVTDRLPSKRLWGDAVVSCTEKDSQFTGIEFS